MTLEEIINYCLSKPEAYVDFPFGDIPMCIKVKKRLFAQIFPKKHDFKITLNCDRITGEYYRSKYPGTVTRGYHSAPGSAVFQHDLLDGAVPDDELKAMIDHSYITVVRKLPKADRKELLEMLSSKDCPA